MIFYYVDENYDEINDAGERMDYWRRDRGWYLMESLVFNWSKISLFIMIGNWLVLWVSFLYLVVFWLCLFFDDVISWEWGVWKGFGNLRREDVVLEIRRNVVELLSSVKGLLKICEYEF